MRDIYGRTRTRWGFQWGMWWLAVLLTVFLGYQASRPLWDADTLIQEKQQSCENAGKVMVKHHVAFGDNYSCREK